MTSLAKLALSGKVALLLFVAATTAAAFLWLPPARGFFNADLARIVVFHLPCSLVGLAATGVGVWYGLRYLAKRDPRDDVKSAAAFLLSLLLWSLTTVTGAIFARAEWGAYWSWDVKQVNIVMLLLIFLAYFALRAAVDDARRRAAVSAAYTLFALAAVPLLTYVLPNSTDNTLHPKHTLFSGQYWTLIGAFSLGLCFACLWAFRLSVAVGELELRMDARARRASSAQVLAPVVVEARP